jgi:NAD+ diphosphatase
MNELFFCDDHLLAAAGGIEPAADAAAADALAQARGVLDSFVVKPQGFRATAFSGAADVAPPGCEWIRIRSLMAAESPRAADACRALGLLNWRAHRRFCGACGGALAEHPAEMARACPACGRVEYPCISPAVIVRIEKDGKLLLARHARRSRSFYTCIAGYVESGESAEDAVRREVREEVGIDVDGVRYEGSQPWPFPNQLMLAFSARWTAGELALQADEIAEADWFDPARLPEIPPPGSVARRLILGKDG